MNVYTVIGKVVVGSAAVLMIIGLTAALELWRDRIAAWWGMRQGPRDITGAPFPDIRRVGAPQEVRFMPSHRDEGEETMVPEGGVARPPHVDHATPSNTTPLAYLRDDEWQLWTTVIKDSAR